MLLHIPRVLTAEQVAQCTEALVGAEWVDGKVTAGSVATKAKNNMQVPTTDPVGQKLGEMIARELNGNGLSENLWTLTVTLTSDAETPLPPPTTPLCTFSGFTDAIPETGQVQHLASDFASCFGPNNGALPAIDVTSDVSDSRGVPEPSSLALLGAGLAGLGFARRRKA